ncbi:hypothetical protein FOL47_010048 [Perkinsus chesapeaki]|uniref:RING-type domain-containing protein n=1 Tax=Perkinsus chesapeaki TaxID=330153 RepID=A0A7J6L507_PERCH|nr:hypothetical protein FOL47_010048 [Perkinsus chesapeaki]
MIFLEGLPYVGPTILTALIMDYILRRLGYPYGTPIDISPSANSFLRFLGSVMVIAGCILIIFMLLFIGIVLVLTGAFIEDLVEKDADLSQSDRVSSLVPTVIGRRILLQATECMVRPEDTSAVCTQNSFISEDGFSQGPCCAICLGDESDLVSVVELIACGHRFHRGCLEAHVHWSLKKQKIPDCPLCRGKFMAV